MTRRCVLLAALLLTSGAARAHADRFSGASGSIRLSPPRVTRAPVLDGRIDDEEWRTAAVLDDFTHGRPVEGVRDSLGTQCLVMYDDRHLYVAFRCPEQPGAVQAPVVRRDDIWGGDWVGVSIDSYRDRQRSYFFGANPQGVQADGIDQEGSDTDMSPDFQFASEGRAGHAGFEVEFAIPFKSLRFSPSDRVTFGFNAIRDQRRTGAHMYWAPITRQVSGYHRQLGDLEGLEGIRPGRNLELNPFVTGAGLGAREAGVVRWDDPETRQGFDLKYGITSAITANVAVTPDFSQVEADAGVLDVNLRNSVFFSEKRSFFLEGVDIFRTPMNMVYTRRIADPLYGLKLTGKSGRTAFGVLQAADRSAARSLEGIPDAVNPYAGRNAQFSIGRIRHDVSDDLSIGALVTTRDHRDATNRVVSADARFTFRKRFRAALQSVHTWNRDPDLATALAALDSASSAALGPWPDAPAGRRTQGSAHHAELEYSSRVFDLYSHIEDITRDFNTLSGFFNRPGTFEVYHWGAAHLFPRRRTWYQQIQPEFSLQHLYDHGEQGVTGRLTDFSFRPQLIVKLPGSNQFGGGFNRLYTAFGGREFSPRWRGFLHAERNSGRLIRPGFFVSYGDEVIYSEAAPALSVDAECWAEVRFTERFDGALSLNATRITRRENGSRFAQAMIPRTRLGYQFSRELSVRWIAEFGERRRFDADDRLTRLSRGLSNDVLVTYLLRPGTVVYLGYGARLGSEHEDPLTARQHSLFMKASYLWRL